MTAGGFSPIRRHRALQAARGARVTTFAASFDSMGDCDHEIYEGDEIAYLPGNGGQPACAECVEDFQRENE